MIDPLTREERLQLLLKEWEVIQSVFNKYDAVLYQQRYWFITIWSASVGAAVAFNKPVLVLVPGYLTAVFWFLEGLLRWQSWWKYVARYRTIRDHLNGRSSLRRISVFDSTNTLMPKRNGEFFRRFADCFLKMDCLAFYLLFFAASIFTLSSVFPDQASTLLTLTPMVETSSPATTSGPAHE